ncbi:hypothetical protein H0H92_000197 [Tricholoma furcatifolium]|nr:hypothetical protein H0H92_000197 [Tricholoma furcatifolium]
MGCCGDSVEQQTPQTVKQLNTGIVTQQPTLHPGIQQQQQQQQQQQVYQQPTIPTPPPAHAPNGAASWGLHNGHAMQAHVQDQFGTFPQGAAPPVNLQAQYNGSLFNPASLSGYGAVHDPVMRPGSAHHRSTSSGSPPYMMTTPPAPQTLSPPPDEGKMSVSIDFGTTFSGVAYGSSRIAGGQVQQILHWPGSPETFRKIPTCLLYDEHGRILAWGLEAKNASPMPGTTRCEWFKLFLEPHALRDQSTIDPRLPALPHGKMAIDLIVDFLSCLWEHAKDQITHEIGAVADLNSADVWLTVPAAWDGKGCEIMREAAISAGLVQSAHAGDTNWRDRLRIITEPEAAAVHCAQLTDLHHLKPSQNFIVVDAGGGTVDLIIGQMANLEIAEISARSGANCGSLFLDVRFRELVKALLEEHPAHLDPASLAYFNNMFHFTCFNVDDPHDSSVGLINGQLSIPGSLLRREVFDPIVGEVLQLIEEQIQKVDQRIDALLLVGGFAGSEYLKQRIEERFSSRVQVIARPADADTATLRGAARYGLARRPLVSSIIAPRSYIMKVKLPAEQEDYLKRPAYIRTNDAGAAICDNRLQYLVSKGAILRKGFDIRGDVVY